MNHKTLSKLLFCVTGAAIFITTTACSPDAGQAGLRSFVIEQLDLNRTRTMELITKMEETGQAEKILKWSPPTKRVCPGWQILHIAAAEDNLANKYLRTNTLVSKELNELSSQDDKLKVCEQLPELSTIKAYLKDSRASLKEAVQNLDLNKLDEKPTPEAWGTGRKLLHVYLWHEGHHQGQVHISFNMYRAAFNLPKKEK